MAVVREIEQAIAGYIQDIDKLNAPIVAQRNTAMFRDLEPHLLPELCKIVLEFAAHDKSFGNGSINDHGLSFFNVLHGRYASWGMAGELMSMGTYNLGTKEGQWKEHNGKGWCQRNYPDDGKLLISRFSSRRRASTRMIETFFASLRSVPLL